MTQTASAYERIPGDRYFTPSWVTEALLSVERFTDMVLDPCAGAGHMLDPLKAAGIVAHGCDIEPGRDDITQGDFLLQDTDVANILANPPYGVQQRLAVAFIKQALKLTEHYGGKVAMLLPVNFDAANGRRWMFADHPAFAAKYILTRRIRWANLEQSAAGPTVNHQWLCWDWRKRPGTPITVGYLPNGATKNEHAHAEVRADLVWCQH